MHRYSTSGLYGLNDLMTQVSIREANLTWHKRSRPSKECRLFTRLRACIPNAAWQVSLSLYVFVALKYKVYFKYVCADSKRPSQQVFNPVGTEQLIPGYNL